jgi:hypothetical protein
MNMKRLTTLITVLIAVAFTSYAQESKTALKTTTPTVVATEEWYATMDNDAANHWTQIFQKYSDGTITITGSWVHPPTESSDYTGVLTVDGINTSITLQGTATNLTAPVGYQTSPFTFSSTGVANNGTATGTYTINFTTAGWPASWQGTFSSTRTSGSGITAQISGVNNTTLDKQLILYPNPASNNITVNSDGEGLLTIYNATGAVVKTEQLTQDSQQINISNLPNGIYIATIQSKEMTKMDKLVIKR